MLLFKALQNRAVSRLWIGQLGSAIGDEVYRMAFIWLAVSFIGADTGYLAALQLLAVLALGIFGGRWADRWSPYKTMIGVDLLRALITMTPVVLYYLHTPSFVALVISSICLSGLGAFFEPALQTVLPVAAGDAATLKAANGLMSTTFRFARIAGPAIIGVLSLFMATIHFFTLNAFSYLLSTWSVFSIRKSIPTTGSLENFENDHILTSFFNALKVLKTKPEVKRALLLKTYCGGAWTLAYGLGMALLVHQLDGNNVKAFGFVMGAYGFGNILGALILGNMERKQPLQMVFWGLVYTGVAFSLMGLTKNYELLILMSGLTGLGGPINDLPFTDLIQIHFRAKDLHKVVRLRIIFENLFSLIFLAISPMLFRFFEVRKVIFCIGVMIFVCGVYGLLGAKERVRIEA